MNQELLPTRRALGALLAVCAAAALLASPLQAAQGTAPATADEPAVAADTHVDDGEIRAWLRAGDEAFAAGRYAEAESWYEKAYAVRPGHDVAANLAEAELEQDKRAEAAGHLRASLRAWPVTADPAGKAKWQDKLAATEQLVGRVRIETEAGSTVTIDGTPAGEAPLSEVLYLEPGKHRFSASQGTRRAPEQEVAIDAGLVTVVRLELGPKPDGGEEKGGGREDGPSTLWLALGYGAGGAAVITAVVLGGVAAGKASEADDLLSGLQTERGPSPCQGPDATCQQLFELRGERDGLANAALWTGIAGAGVLVATGIYHLSAAMSAGGSSQPKISMLVGPAYAGMSGSW